MLREFKVFDQLIRKTWTDENGNVLKVEEHSTCYPCMDFDDYTKIDIMDSIFEGPYPETISNKREVEKCKIVYTIINSTNDTYKIIYELI